MHLWLFAVLDISTKTSGNILSHLDKCFHWIRCATTGYNHCL
ncbi:Uncharacterised protein [Salmonella enterica subsp. enterica]|uniref:Uncharacterized protein n=1 Tax=Salmonella enterica I TaxID=59201 RepID=A0A380CFV7_SALET|nr:Uncharacterised protein [Salmonella enterica subsp. enterica]